MSAAIYFILAAIVIAPHLEKRTARMFALVYVLTGCIALLPNFISGLVLFLYDIGLLP